MQLNTAAVQEYRTFLYGLLVRDASRRRYILWEWLQNFQHPVASTAKLLREIWHTILETLLWQRSQFIVESSKFFLLGPAFPIRYEWLTKSERQDYIVKRVFAHRKQLFETVEVMRNNTVHLEGFEKRNALTEVDSIEGVWRRQWVRDIASWVKGQVALEFTCAVQRLALERGDVFLSELFVTLHGCGRVTQLVCWGHGPQDRVRPREEEEGGN